MRLPASLSLPLLFSGCAGTSIGRVYTRFITITQHHRIAPPWQRNLASLLLLPPLLPLSSPSPLWPPPPGCYTAHSYLPHGTAQVQASCAAVAPAPALSATYTLALSPSHGVIASPRLGNATSCVAVATAIIAIASPSPLWQTPPLCHAVTDATYKTAPLRCQRFWRHREAKRHYAEGIGRREGRFLGG